MKFAKVFELENDEQVLVVIEADSDDYNMTVCSDIDGLRVETKLGFETDEARQKAFDSIDIPFAERIRKTLEGVVS